MSTTPLLPARSVLECTKYRDKWGKTKMKVHVNEFEFDEVQVKHNRERYLLAGKIVALQCTDCKEAFGLDGFHDNKACLAGKNSKCKACHNEKSRRWNKQNQERHRANYKLWYNNNLERKKEANKRWYNNNLERAKANHKRYYEENKFYYLTRDHNKHSQKAGLTTNLTVMDVDMLFAIAGSTDAKRARCMITGLWTDTPHIAHVISRANGGEASMKNLIVVDASVNLKQGTMHLLDWLTTEGAIEVADKEAVRWTVEYLAQRNCMSIKGYLNDQLGWDKANSFYDIWLADELEEGCLLEVM